MIQMLAGLILLPVALVLFVAVGGAAYQSIRHDPVLWWTLVGFVVVFTPIFTLAAWNDWKRKREIREFNERKAREAGGQTAKV